MRNVIAFDCGGETLVGTIDCAGARTGLLIVSGGNEPRMGAHRGMAMLAAHVAAAGWPVFRYDRRGVGDSSGANDGWASAGPDLSAAAAAFRRAAPQVERLVGFGNCDAATTLVLFGAAAGIEALVLANPWVVERAADDLPPPAAIRARYAERLRSPAAWLRLATGGVSIRSAIKGLQAIAKPSRNTSLAHSFADVARGRLLTVILADGDATAIAYADATKSSNIAAHVVRVPTASHSFARADDGDALKIAVIAALARYSAASASSSNSAA